MGAHRHVRLFKNGRSQAVRIPREFELPGQNAVIYRDGDRLVLEAAPTLGLLGVLRELGPLSETLPEVDDPPPAPVL